MTPLGELRAGIPYGLTQDLPPILTFATAVAGNMAPVVFLLWGLPKFEKIIKIKNFKSTKNLKSFHPFSSVYFWYRNRTERKHFKRFQNLGALTLVIFVAIPLPLTGGWSGALAAHIFHIPPKKSAGLILIGVMIAGLLVSLITLGIL